MAVRPLCGPLAGTPMTIVDADPSTDQRATIREWIGLAVIALPCMLYTMDLTILNFVIPVITREPMPTA